MIGDCRNCAGKGAVTDAVFRGITHERKDVTRKCGWCKGTGRNFIPEPLYSLVRDDSVYALPEWMTEIPSD